MQCKVGDRRACECLDECNGPSAPNNHSQHPKDMHMLLAQIFRSLVCAIGRAVRHQRTAQTYAACAVQLEPFVGIARVAPSLFSILRSLFSILRSPA
jgi:hypothetical protein